MTAGNEKTRSHQPDDEVAGMGDAASGWGNWLFSLISKGVLPDLPTDIANEGPHTPRLRAAHY